MGQMQGCHQERLKSQKCKWLSLSDNFHEWGHRSDFLAMFLTPVPSSTVPFRGTPTHMSLYPAVTSESSRHNKPNGHDIFQREKQRSCQVTEQTTDLVWRKKSWTTPLPLWPLDLGSIWKPFSYPYHPVPYLSVSMVTQSWTYVLTYLHVAGYCLHLKYHPGGESGAIMTLT